MTCNTPRSCLPLEIAVTQSEKLENFRVERVYLSRFRGQTNHFFRKIERFERLIFYVMT